MIEVSGSINNGSRVQLGSFDANKNFSRGASKPKEAVWYIIKVIFFLSALPFPYRFKAWLLRMFGAKIGRGVIIKPRVNIHFPWKLSIGNDVWIGEEVFMLNFEQLTIGDNVCVSQRVLLCGGNHNYKDPEMPYRNGPISLHNGCWIGAACFVGPNVTVGTDTVVAAGSIVSKSLYENAVYSGNPLSFIKHRWI